MSTENTQESVSTESASATTETTSTPSQGVTSFEGLQQAAKEAQSPKAAATTPTQAATPAQPAYVPNFKYKAALQDKEVDEFWRGLIKDADSEKKVKEALTKLDGFDHVKSSREKIQAQHESLQNDFAQQTQRVARVEGALQKGDLTSVFRQLGVKDEDIYKWTQSKLQMMEMPPEQRKAFEDADNMRLQQSQMEEQMSQYQQMYEQQAVQARTLQLDFALSRPEVMSVAQNWDNLQGTPGAFRDLIIAEAQHAYFHSQGQKDLTADQAVQLVMQKFGKVMNMGGGMQAPQVQAPQSQTPTIQTQSKPVIPNINGKGASPIKKAPRSIDDLKRMAKEAQAFENQN